MPYPGDQAIVQAASELCLDVLSGHIGGIGQRTDLDMAVVSPTPDSWQRAGDREVACFVTAADGSLLSQPVGS